MRIFSLLFVLMAAFSTVYANAAIAGCCNKEESFVQPHPVNDADANNPYAGKNERTKDPD